MVLALAVWPVIPDRGVARDPFIFRARRAGRRQLDTGAEGTARNLARSGITVNHRAKHRWVPDGDPLGAEDWITGECECGRPYRGKAKTLRRSAAAARNGGKDRYTIPGR